MDVVDFPKRFEVWVVRLDPTEGVEMRKIRPCVIVSPDEMNELSSTIIIAPLTSTVKRYPTRVTVQFKERDGEVALDHLRSVDKSRLANCLGALNEAESRQVAKVLVEMFSY